MITFRRTADEHALDVHKNNSPSPIASMRWHPGRSPELVSLALFGALNLSELEQCVAELKVRAKPPKTEPPPEPPQFDHLCPHCEFLGQWANADQYQYDLYICRCVTNPRTSYIVARFGNYTTQFEASDVELNGVDTHLPAMTEAKNRAIARGFLPT